MKELEIKKLKLSISRASVGIEELEIKKLERLQDIKRIDEHIAIQRAGIDELKEKLKNFDIKKA